MSTHNFQFELEERSYAIQITPFEQEGHSCHRVIYNDSRSLVFCRDLQTGKYAVSGNGSEQISGDLKARLQQCIEQVKVTGNRSSRTQS